MKNFFKVFFLFSILGLLVYSNSLNNKFLIDDYVFINAPGVSTAQSLFSQWNPYREQLSGVADNHRTLEYYRPLAHMVYDLCYPAFRNNFWQYHLFNLFLFVLASSLIYLFIQRLTGNFNLAFLAGLFYLIHPVNGIIVNYISASVFAFQVICTLGTILLLLESLERKDNRVFYFLSLAGCFLSLFWNESGIMTPFYVSAVVLLLRKGAYKTRIMYLLPYFVIVFSYIIFRLFFISINDVIFKKIALSHISLWEYPANLFQIFSWYIAQLFYPKGIVMQWAAPLLHGHVFWNNVGALSMLLFFFLLFVRFSKEKMCQLGLAWILIGFAPACVAAFRMPENGIQIEPHWFVVSSIGFFILAAYFCLFILDRTKQFGALLLFILIFAWGSVSHANNQLWADQKTYALYWSQQVPHLRSTYFYLADAYQRQGALKESRKYYQLALAGRPSDIEIYNNLGLIDQAEGHFKEAELNFRMALKIDPYVAAIYNNLGAIDADQGHWEQAKQNFDRAMRLNPFLLEPRRGLASIFLRHSEYQKAINACLGNLDIVSNDPQTLFFLIDIFIQENDLVSLKKYAYRCMNSLTDPKGLTRLGIVMAQHNIPDMALDCFEKAIHIEGDYKEAYLAGGTLLIDMGMIDKAVNMWKIGLSIDPSDGRFKENIAKVRALEADKRWAMKEFILPIMHKVSIDQNFNFDKVKVN